MANRITQGDLNLVVEQINRAHKQELAPVIGGKWQIGTYCLDQAYGGCKLVQIVNDSGGQRDVFQRGYVTKRELFNDMHSYLRGIEDYIER